jgi:hypothetical protein
MASGTCGNCGASLYTNGTCPNCDRPRIRVLAWWELLDLQWEAEQAALDRLDSVAVML